MPKLSVLPGAAPLTGNEILPLVQTSGGAKSTVQATVEDLAAHSRVNVGVFEALGNVSIPADIDTVQTTGAAIEGAAGLGASQLVRTDEEGETSYRRQDAIGAWWRVPHDQVTATRLAAVPEALAFIRCVSCLAGVNYATFPDAETKDVQIGMAVMLSEAGELQSRDAGQTSVPGVLKGLVTNVVGSTVTFNVETSFAVTNGTGFIGWPCDNQLEDLGNLGLAALPMAQAGRGYLLTRPIFFETDGGGLVGNQASSPLFFGDNVNHHILVKAGISATLKDLTGVGPSYEGRARRNRMILLGAADASGAAAPDYWDASEIVLENIACTRFDTIVENARGDDLRHGWLWAREVGVRVPAVPVGDWSANHGYGISNSGRRRWGQGVIMINAVDPALPLAGILVRHGPYDNGGADDCHTEHIRVKGSIRNPYQSRMSFAGKCGNNTFGEMIADYCNLLPESSAGLAHWGIVSGIAATPSGGGYRKITARNCAGIMVTANGYADWGEGQALKTMVSGHTGVFEGTNHFLMNILNCPGKVNLPSLVARDLNDATTRGLVVDTCAETRGGSLDMNGTYLLGATIINTPRVRGLQVNTDGIYDRPIDFGDNCDMGDVYVKARGTYAKAVDIAASRGVKVEVDAGGVYANGARFGVSMVWTLNNAGANYAANDILTGVGGAGTLLSVKVVTVNGSGAILTFTVLEKGVYSTLPANPCPTTAVNGSGGASAGTGATFNLATPSAQGCKVILTPTTEPTAGVIAWADVGTVKVNRENRLDRAPGYEILRWAGSTAVGAAFVQNGGAGYTVNDVLSLAGGTHTTTGQLTVASVNAGVITSVTISNPGNYSVMPNSPVSVTGGTGTGATFNLGAAVDVTGYSLVEVTSPATTQPLVALLGGYANQRVLVRNLGAGGLVMVNSDSVGGGLKNNTGASKTLTTRFSAEYVCYVTATSFRWCQP